MTRLSPHSLVLGFVLCLLGACGSDDGSGAERTEPTAESPVTHTPGDEAPGDEAPGDEAPTVDDPNVVDPGPPPITCEQGGRPRGSPDEPCDFLVDGCCYDVAVTACSVAGCDPAGCEILESYPAQVRCR